MDNIEYERFQAPISSFAIHVVNRWWSSQKWWGGVVPKFLHQFWTHLCTYRKRIDQHYDAAVSRIWGEDMEAPVCRASRVQTLAHRTGQKRNHSLKIIVRNFNLTKSKTSNLRSKNHKNLSMLSRPKNPSLPSRKCFDHIYPKSEIPHASLSLSLPSAR